MHIFMHSIAYLISLGSNINKVLVFTKHVNCYARPGNLLMLFKFVLGYYISSFCKVH